VELILAQSIDNLPQGCGALLPSDPFTSAAWYRIAAAHALPDDAIPCFAVLSQDGRPCAVIPLLRQGGGRGLTSLTTPYTCVYRPLLAMDAEPELLEAAGQRFGQFCHGWPTVRLDAVPSEWPGLPAFLSGLRQSGLWVQTFQHFGNWHEAVQERSWAAYLADRPGPVRETVRRKLKRWEQEGRFELFSTPPHLERGIDAFEAVYCASWKAPEPFPRFNAALMRDAAGRGTLRLGVLWLGDRPAAAQFWIVADGRATVLKLAHDKALKTLSPGTVLTVMMLRGLLDKEQVTDLDFGRGDDVYKALWATQRHQRIGLLLMNPWQPAGAVEIARSLGGRLRAAAGRALNRQNSPDSGAAKWSSRVYNEYVTDRSRTDGAACR
jgi:CelD/BcsL family acetyltransferase involved in cellulose biosynthesis